MAATPSRITYSEDGQIELPVDPDDPGYALDVLMREGKMEEASAELERLVLEGVDSGPAIEVTPTFWEDFKADLHRNARRRQ